MLIDDYGLDSDFLKSSLDEEESSRVEQEENQTLIIVDTAVSDQLALASGHLIMVVDKKYSTF